MLNHEFANHSTLFNTFPEFQRPVMYIAGTSDTLASFRLFEPQVNNVRRAYGIEAGSEEVISSDRQHAWTRYGNSTATFETIQHDYRASLLLGGHCFTRANSEGGSGIYSCDGPWNVGEQVLDFFKQNPCNRQWAHSESKQPYVCDIHSHTSMRTPCDFFLWRVVLRSLWF